MAIYDFIVVSGQIVMTQRNNDFEIGLVNPIFERTNTVINIYSGSYSFTGMKFANLGLIDGLAPTDIDNARDLLDNLQRALAVLPSTLPTDASTETKQDQEIIELSAIKDKIFVPRTDSFGLQEVASPQSIFDAQFTYDLQPLLYEQVTANGTITHDTTNRAAVITSTGVGNTFLQSYEYFRYQPGKGQKIYITFNFKDVVAGKTKYVQYGDSTNAMGLRQLGDGTVEVFITTGTSEGNQTQIIDTNALGIDLTKEQILIIQFEALYVGSVQFGLQLGNDVVWIHTFTNSNSSNFPYIQTANLPIRVGINSTSATTTTMMFNCTSVQTSAGVDNVTGYTFTQDAELTASNGTRTHAITVRPKLLFNGFTNRAQIKFLNVDILTNDNNSLKWELCIGQALTGTTTFTDVNTGFSAVEYNTSGSLSGTPTIIFESGYVAGARIIIVAL